MHHAAFDRDAGKGYKFNHIHCLCSLEDKRFLESIFEDSKFIGSNNIIQYNNNNNVMYFYLKISVNEERLLLGENIVPLTAIIKVKDAPGGLWEVLNKIGVSIYLVVTV